MRVFQVISCVFLFACQSIYFYKTSIKTVACKYTIMYKSNLRLKAGLQDQFTGNIKISVCTLYQLKVNVIVISFANL